MKTITIDVTQEDIDKGVSTCCSLCPVARAIQRALPEFVKVEACYEFIYLHHSDGHISRIATPGYVEGFFWKFDKAKPVSPFACTLEVPE